MVIGTLGSHKVMRLQTHTVERGPDCGGDLWCDTALEVWDGRQVCHAGDDARRDTEDQEIRSGSKRKTSLKTGDDKRLAGSQRIPTKRGQCDLMAL